MALILSPLFPLFPVPCGYNNNILLDISDNAECPPDASNCLASYYRTKWLCGTM